MAPGSIISEEDHALCLSAVAEHSLDYYLCDLLLDAPARMAATVVHAFHVEMTSAVLAASEPMIGEIRLQWWADVLAGERKEEALGNPLARALLSTVEHHGLPVAGLQAKISAHIFDLYRDPMETRTMLEGWCGETRSILFQLVALGAGAAPSTQLANLCGHAGVALGITGIIENLAFQRARGQVYVPLDLLSAVGTDAGGFLAQANRLQHDAVQAMIELAREHYDHAMQLLAAQNGGHVRAFLPLSLVPLYLDRAEKQLPLTLSGLPQVSQLRKQWVLWRSARKVPFI